MSIGGNRGGGVGESWRGGFHPGWHYRALQPEIKSGDIVVATAAVRADGASKCYVPLEFPAVADLDVTTALVEAARKLEQKVHLGLVLTRDVFYGDIENLRFWSRFNVLSVEMESSAIFTIASLKKLKAGTILAVDGNPLLGVGKGEFEHVQRTGELDRSVQNAIKIEAQIAIEAVKMLENMSKARRSK